ncbi:PIN domain-containing protein [bacterium]|nr:MAG: PIN domain-containing protein [bacterium]
MGSSRVIVLDSQMWIWFHRGDPRLPENVRDEIRRLRERVSISAVTIWEVALATQKGRIVSAVAPEEMVLSWLRTVPMNVVPLDVEIALLSRTLPFEHEDPADRFIAATAHRLGAPLATGNAPLTALPWLKTIS